MSFKHSFIIGVTRLRKEPGSMVSFDLTGQLSDLKVSSSYVEDIELIAVVGIAESVHGGILITGIIRTIWKGECRRCLGLASGAMEIPVRELYERVESGMGAISDGDTYPYSGDVIDLSEMVKDQVLLGLPLAPLCTEECKGLCVSCGAELNKGLCGCDNEAIDLRWGALDVLTDEDR